MGPEYHKEEKRYFIPVYFFRLYLLSLASVTRMPPIEEETNLSEK